MNYIKVAKNIIVGEGEDKKANGSYNKESLPSLSKRFFGNINIFLRRMEENDEIINKEKKRLKKVTKKKKNPAKKTSSRMKSTRSVRDSIKSQNHVNLIKEICDNTKTPLRRHNLQSNLTKNKKEVNNIEGVKYSNNNYFPNFSKFIRSAKISPDVSFNNKNNEQSYFSNNNSRSPNRSILPTQQQIKNRLNIQISSSKTIKRGSNNLVNNNFRAGSISGKATPIGERSPQYARIRFGSNVNPQDLIRKRIVEMRNIPKNVRINGIQERRKNLGYFGYL